MSTDTTWRIDSNSSVATEKLGRDIGARLKGGEVIELRSDLGGGKTTLVRGLAAGAGSQDAVGSPSFTICRQYLVRGPSSHKTESSVNRINDTVRVRTSHITPHISQIVHYDFYRLCEPGLMAQELAEAIDDPQAVVVVEWADVAEHVLPAERVVIKITPTGESGRTFDISLPAKYEYLRDSK